MPRKKNPYGYTINENALKRNKLTWGAAATEKMKLPVGTRKTSTSQRGEFCVIDHEDLLRAAAKEAQRVTGVHQDDVINAVNAYRNVAIGCLANGVDVDLLGLVDIRVRNIGHQNTPPSKTTKRVSTKIKSWLSGLLRLVDERPDLPITPQNWHETLFEHGAHISKTPGYNAKQRDLRQDGKPEPPGYRTYDEILDDIKNGR